MNTRSPITDDFTENSTIGFEYTTRGFVSDPEGLKPYESAFVQALQDTVEEWGANLSNEDGQALCISTLEA